MSAAVVQTGFACPVEWDEAVNQHLHRALGQIWPDIRAALSVPANGAWVRVNTLKTTVKEAMEQLQEIVGPAYQVTQHPKVSIALLVHANGHSNEINYSVCGGKEVVVTRRTGEAIMKGADLYAPGVLACSAAVSAGDLVAVSVALEENGSLPFTRGTTLELGPTITGSPATTPTGRLLLGIGRAIMSRTEMFRVPSGLAVSLQQRVHDSPSLNGQLPGAIMLQHLPSIVAAMALAPLPGARVLDMCAAPGGKTTVLAQLMGDQGEVIAFDRTHVKAEYVQSLAAEQGMTCIKAYKQDALRAVTDPAAASTSNADGQLDADAPSSTGHPGAGPEPNAKEAMRQARKLAALAARGQAANPSMLNASKQQHGEVCRGYPPGSFEYILLDAPCTATGLRPRLLQPLDMQYLHNTASYQRKLLDVAVKLLKPGGYLVYSTCSITPDENECNVRYVLDRHPSMRLVPQPVHIGGSGLQRPAHGQDGMISSGHSGSEGMAAHPAASREQLDADVCQHGATLWLTQEEAKLVQRFDPRGPTIGFFCAKFCKDPIR